MCVCVCVCIYTEGKISISSPTDFLSLPAYKNQNSL